MAHALPWLACVAATAHAAGLTATKPLLEDLARQHGSDKMADMHSYVSAYEMLFDALRLRVGNVTEIGVHFARSLLMWHRYFPSAHVYGIDISVQPQAHDRVRDARSERLHLLPSADSRDCRTTERLQLAASSMDVVFDDGDHSPSGNLATLQCFWPLVKPGGFYVIEDVITGGNAHGHYARSTAKGGGGALDAPGYSYLAHNGSHWPPFLREIYEQNSVVLIDSLVGSRNFDEYRHANGKWVRDRVSHNSHLLVIRRRRTPRTHALHRFATGPSRAAQNERNRKGLLVGSSRESSNTTHRKYDLTRTARTS
jgi:predicted O-methyltransferase YrrM